MATIALMLIGLIGSVLLFIPGSPLILLGAFIYAWYTDFLVVTWGTLVILLLLTVLAKSWIIWPPFWGRRNSGPAGGA